MPSTHKQHAYHDFIKIPCPENKVKYGKLNLFCEKHIEIAKIKNRKYYFKKYKDDSMKQWQMINNLLNRRNKTVSINKVTNCDGVTVAQPKFIANCLNDYFSDGER